MLRRLSLTANCVVLLFVLTFARPAALPAQASPLISSGCAYVNANGGTGVDLYIDMNGMPMTFYGGETVYVSASGPADYIVVSDQVTSTGLAGNDTGIGPAPTSIFWTIPATGSYELFVGANYNNGETVTISCAAAAQCIFTDGRLNCLDAGQTAAVYCQADGSVEVLAIYQGKGYPAFVATAAEIAKVPTNPVKNMLIKQGNGAFLYRLTGGLLQINRVENGTGKVYSFRFADCPKP